MILPLEKEENNIPMANVQSEFMTIYYRKKTGEIKEFISDKCDMSVFGNEQEDYELIWDYIHIEVDETVKNNRQQFMIDLETKELIYTPLVAAAKYRIKE